MQPSSQDSNDVPAIRRDPPLAGLIRLTSAPMAGISTPVFRRLCREKGATLTFTEMISARGVLMKNRATRNLLARGNGESQVAAQIFGNEPGIMAYAAQTVERAGFCLVDVNMGCPVRKVAGAGSGAGLMREPALACDIIAAIREKVSIPVTAKIRSGWDSENINAVSMARGLEKAGASVVTVHARTRSQGYGGQADWGLIARVAAAVKIPVIGNGDVVDGPSAKRLVEETGCSGVMVGRASLGNPWVFSEISSFLEGTPAAVNPSKRERYLIFLRHLRGTITESGMVRGMRQFRTYALWYTKGIRGAAAARRRMQKTTSPKELRHIVKDLYGLT
jgi:tRNA-dihydrouridine synthase B